MSSAPSRKYSPEQIQAEITRPKGKGGRPKKYHSEEEKKEARRLAARRAYHRKRDIIEGFVVEGSLALRKTMHSTDEERRNAHRISSAIWYQSHKDEKKLYQTAYRGYSTNI